MMRDFMPVNQDPLFFSFMNPAREPPVGPSINNIKFAALLTPTFLTVCCQE